MNCRTFISKYFYQVFLSCFFSINCLAGIIEDVTPSSAHIVSPTYFGTHIGHLFLRERDKALGGRPTSWPDVRVGSIRLWDSSVRWAEIAPKAGDWQFERLDMFVDKASTEGSDILYTLGSTPRWASVRPDEPCPYGFGCSSPPIRMGHWEEYVRRVAQRYKGRISAYEIWNEPKLSDFPGDIGAAAFFTGSTAELVEMTRIARKVIKSEDPSALILTPGFTNGPARLDQFLRLGGRELVDVVAYHFYSRDFVQFAQQIQAVREVMAANGVANIPLWNTETGLEVYLPNEVLPPGATRVTREVGAGRMVQYMVLGAAAGLERFFYYAWDSARSGMVTATGVRWPSYLAMSRVTDWLTGSSLQGCKSWGAAGVECLGQKGESKFTIIWHGGDTTKRVTVPVGYKFSYFQKAFQQSEITIITDSKNNLDVAAGEIPCIYWFVKGN